MVTTFYPPFNFGGDGQYVRRLAHALARRGHRVEVIHDADAYRVLGGSADPAPPDEPPGVTVHTLRSRTPVLSCLATQQLGRPLVHGAHDPPDPRRRLRRDPLPQRLAGRGTGDPGVWQGREALHGPRALARLSHAHPVAPSPRDLHGPPVSPLRPRLPPAAAAVAGRRSPRPPGAACGRVHRPEPVQCRQACRVRLRAADDGDAVLPARCAGGGGRRPRGPRPPLFPVRGSARAHQGSARRHPRLRRREPGRSPRRGRRDR